MEELVESADARRLLAHVRLVDADLVHEQLLGPDKWHLVAVEQPEQQGGEAGQRDVEAFAPRRVARAHAGHRAERQKGAAAT